MPLRRKTALAFAISAVLLAGSRASAQVALLQTAPETATENEPLVIGGQVADAQSVGRLVLFYRVGAEWKQVEFDVEPPDTYLATIPAEDIHKGSDPKGTFVQYYVVAFGAGGNPIYAFASPDAPERVKIVEPGAVLAGQLPPQVPIQPEKPKGPPIFHHPEEGPLTNVSTGYPLEANFSPNTVSTVSSERIRALGLRTLADLAALLPGMSVTRDVQGFWHVTVRGRLSDAEVVVLYDGQRLNNPYDGKVNWELPLDNIDRVEVQEAPGAALAGPSAFTVISLIPIRRDGIGASVTGGVEDSSGGPPGVSYGAHLNAAHTFSKVKLFVDGDFDSRTGSSQLVQTDAVPRTGAAGATDDRRLGAGGGLRAEFSTGHESYLYLDVRGYHELRGALLGGVDVVDPASSLEWDTGSATFGGHFVTGSWTLDLKLFGNEQYTDRSLALFPAGDTVAGVLVSNDVKLNTTIGMTTAGAQFTAFGAFGKVDALTLGVDLQRQSITSFSEGLNVGAPVAAGVGDLGLPAGTTYPAQDPNYATRLIGGVFVENAWRPLDLLRITVGVRGDAATGINGLTLLPQARAAIVLHPWDVFTLRGEASRATRLPTFEELLTVLPLSPAANDGLATGFNPAALLQPVGVTTGEVGIDIAQGVGPGQALLRLTGFVNQYDNPIEVLPEASGMQYMNRTGGEQYLGVEGEARYDWKQLGTVFANVSWFRGQDLAVSSATPLFSYLTAAPQLRGNAGVIIPVWKLGTLSATLTAGSERRNDTVTDLQAQRSWEIPSYALVSITARSAPIGRFFDIAASVYSVSLAGPYLDPVPRPDTLPGLLPREGVTGLLTVRATY